MKRISRFAAATALLGLTIALAMMFVQESPSAVAQVPTPTPLDHFKCYATQGQPLPDGVLLRDQFDRLDQKAEFARVIMAIRFCNPVSKIHGDVVAPIENPDAHLKLYFMLAFPQGKPRQVIVSNQFGEQKLEVSRPLFLAVPTQKNDHREPKGLDHFKCYIARGESVDATVALRDQFVSEDGVAVGAPVLLCNPTLKIHNRQVTPIENPEGHLVCYRIKSQDFSGKALTRNQFGQEGLELRTADLLCAPSKKAIPSPG